MNEILTILLDRKPEYETEINWFIKKFKGFNPIDHHLNSLFLDFEIELPQFIEVELRRTFIGLTILYHEYELEQGSLPGYYRICIEESEYLNEVKKPDEFAHDSYARLIAYYYYSNEKDELDNLISTLEKKVKSWNWHNWVKQEEVYFLLGHHFEYASRRIAISEQNLLQVLNDYYNRMEQVRLNKLESFINKSEALLDESEELKQNAHYFLKILNELKNGGQNLKSGRDLLPHFSGMNDN